MSNFNTELYQALAKGESIDELICREKEEAVNYLLQHELTICLDYEKYDPIGYNSGNSRNGSYQRKIKTRYGEITAIIPRDRNGEFKQQTLPNYQRQTDDLETTILQLYSKGITTAEIADLIEKMYGHSYLPQTISNITKAAEEYVEEFHKRKLNKRYVVIYCDATYLNVRRDSVSKEALHVMIGITENGYKEIVSSRIYPQESSENYREMLKDIKERGCQEVLLFVSDKLKGLSEVCLEEYPRAKYQSCWVHVMRNVGRLVRANDRKEILSQLKPIYQAQDKKRANELLEGFYDRVESNYPKVVKSIKENSYLFSYLEFPKEIQRSLYTTNIVEGAHKQLKRNTNRKEQFPNESALERFVCNQMINYNHRFSNRIHKGFELVQSELIELFEKNYSNEKQSSEDSVL